MTSTYNWLTEEGGVPNHVIYTLCRKWKFQSLALNALVFTAFLSSTSWSFTACTCKNSSRGIYSMFMYICIAWEILSHDQTKIVFFILDVFLLRWTLKEISVLGKATTERLFKAFPSVSHAVNQSTSEWWKALGMWPGETTSFITLVFFVQLGLRMSMMPHFALCRASVHRACYRPCGAEMSKISQSSKTTVESSMKSEHNLYLACEDSTTCIFLLSFLLFSSCPLSFYCTLTLLLSLNAANHRLHSVLDSAKHICCVGPTALSYPSSIVKKCHSSLSSITRLGL